MLELWNEEELDTDDTGFWMLDAWSRLISSVQYLVSSPPEADRY